MDFDIKLALDATHRATKNSMIEFVAQRLNSADTKTLKAICKGAPIDFNDFDLSDLQPYESIITDADLALAYKSYVTAHAMESRVNVE